MAERLPQDDWFSVQLDGVRDDPFVELKHRVSDRDAKKLGAKRAFWVAEIVPWDQDRRSVRA